MHIGGIQVEKQSANVVPRIFAIEGDPATQQINIKYFVACLLGSAPG
jgi:hypothetical protein